MSLTFFNSFINAQISNILREQKPFSALVLAVEERALLSAGETRAEKGLRPLFSQAKKAAINVQVS